MAAFFKYVKFILRRERVISLCWISIVVLTTALVAAIFPSLLEDEMSKIAMIEMLKSPTMVGMLGPAYDVENYTVGITFSHMMTVWAMIALAVMNIFFVIRHTRNDEEQGRLEMLKSLPVGKLTNATATMTTAIALNIEIAILSTISILVVNFEGCTFAGAVAYSFELAVFGILMAAVSLLSAQLFSTARGASGAAFGVLGVFYLMRIAGDYSDSALSYISPMGLGMRVFAFDKNNIYPILIQLAQTAVLVTVSLFLVLNRDLGEGLIPAKKGKAFAKKSLLSPFGLVLRLTKTSAIVWCVVVFVVSAMYGSMLGDLEEFVQSNDFFKQMLQIDSQNPESLLNSFVAVLFLILAHIAVIPVINFASKLRSEENHGRLEQILARNVKRFDLLFAFSMVAFVQSILTLVCSALGMYMASIGTDTIELGQVLVASLCYLPAMWTFLGLAVMLLGVLPKAGTLTWIFYAYSFAIVYLGRMLNLPEILQKFTPFGNIPQLPMAEFDIVPLAILTAISVLLTVVGFWKFNQRDSA